MIDFHCHILPGVDDGPEDVSKSLTMLRRSFLQGVDLIVSTSHFYAYEEYPQEFLQRSNQAFRTLREAMLMSPEVYPGIILGAEVLYFPGISDAAGMENLMIGSSKSILIEPPMSVWTEEMLEDIAELGKKLDCTPVIAHVDRFMELLQDEALIDRVRQRNMAVQVNAAYFLNPKTQKAAFRNLENGKIQLIGSDCHNLDSRPPNMGQARKQAKAFHAEAAFQTLYRNAADMVCRRRG